jgi:hypothetical protein
MAIIDSLKRLERAGSESSRVTAKLHEAAEQVANLICDQAPVGVELPRGYCVVDQRSNIGSSTFLTRRERAEDDEYGDGDGFVTIFVNGTGGYLHGDFHCPIPRQTRDGSLAFAADIAGGLLDEIAAFIEARNAEAERAVAALDDARAQA